MVNDAAYNTRCFILLVIGRQAIVEEIAGFGVRVRPERGGAGGVPPAVGGDGAAGHRLSMRRRLRASRPRAARAHHQRRLM
jgi:hypothetical protein